MEDHDRTFAQKLLSGQWAWFCQKKELNSLVFQRTASLGRHGLDSAASGPCQTCCVRQRSDCALGSCSKGVAPGIRWEKGHLGYDLCSYMHGKHCSSKLVSPPCSKYECQVLLYLADNSFQIVGTLARIALFSLWVRSCATAQANENDAANACA
eukprot:4614012-Amphidinium_carterae.1